MIEAPRALPVQVEFASEFRDRDPAHRRPDGRWASPSRSQARPQDPRRGEDRAGARGTRGLDLQRHRGGIAREEQRRDPLYPRRPGTPRRVRGLRGQRDEARPDRALTTRCPSSCWRRRSPHSNTRREKGGGPRVRRACRHLRGDPTSRPLPRRRRRLAVADVGCRRYLASCSSLTRVDAGAYCEAAGDAARAGRLSRGGDECRGARLARITRRAGVPFGPSHATSNSPTRSVGHMFSLR
jgi:hypothetical protein